MRRTRVRAGRGVVATVVTLALMCACVTGCTGGSAGSTGKPCSSRCSGTLDGARYVIRVPRKWNGTLLMYFHGYVADTGSGPGVPRLSQFDNGGNGDDVASQALLADGYALAGSSYSTAGWAVAQGREAAQQLYRRFVTVVSSPKRVYVWGSSMGGLITELVAERDSWVSGAAPMCGTMAGPLLNADDRLEAIVAAEKLFGVALNRPGAVTVAMRAVTAAARTRAGAAKILYLAALLGLPTRARYVTGTDLASTVQAAAQTLELSLSFALVLLPNLVSRFGGNPAEVAGPQARRPLSPGDITRIDTLSSGGEAGLAATAQSAVPPATSATARAALRASGDPSGELRVPTITLHTVADPLNIAANESVLRQRVADRGRLDRLRQLWIAPPATYDAKQGAPYGLGHCAFTPAQEVGLVRALDGWVRSGKRPTDGTATTLLGAGVDTGFVPPAWPTVTR